jgi:hypothetical protein
MGKNESPFEIRTVALIKFTENSFQISATAPMGEIEGPFEIRAVALINFASNAFGWV